MKKKKKQSALSKCKVCGFKKVPKAIECPICSAKYNVNSSKNNKNDVNYKKKDKRTISNSHPLGPQLVQKTNNIIMRRQKRNRNRHRRKRGIEFTTSNIIDTNIDEKKEEQQVSSREGSLLFNLDKNKYFNNKDSNKKNNINASPSQSRVLSSSMEFSNINSSSSITRFDANKSKLFHLQKPSFLNRPSQDTFNKSSSYVMSKVSDEMSRIFECIPPPKLLLMNRPKMIYKTKLDLSMWPVNDSQWRYIESLNVLTLETLSLKDNLEISDLTLVAIGKKQGATLRHINLDGCNGLELKDGILALLSLCKSLETLNISRCHNVYNDTIKTISLHGAHIKELKCDECININDVGFKYLVDNNMTNLELLSLKNCTQVTGKYLGTLLKASPKLLTIELNDCIWIDDKSLASISAQKIAWGYTDSQGGLIPLKRISIRNCIRVSDAGITWVMSKTRQIKEIDLSGCSITDVSLDLIGKWCSKLSILLISNCIQITNKGLKQLAYHQMEHARNAETSLDGIQELDISGCEKVDDYGIEVIARALQNIRKIDVSRLPNMTDAALRAISKTCILLESINTSLSEQVTGTGIKLIVRNVRTCTTDGKSITLGKKATQSTTLACREASIAVNGNTWGAYGESYDDENGEISQTTFERHPWWEVDLEEIWDVGLLRIWSPSADEMIKYNYPMWVMASETPFKKDDEDYNPDAVVYKKCFRELSRVVKWDLRQRARYVRIQTLNFAPLLLSQVEVYFRGSTSLNVSGCFGIGGYGITEIARRFLHLIKLDVSDNPNVHDRALTLIARNLLNLEELYLSSCNQITDDGMYEMSLHERRYKIVDLTFCNQLSSRGVLYCVTRCKNLKTLHLAYVNPLTDSGIFFIARACRLIQTLTLHGCSLITEEGILRCAPYLKYARAEYNLEEDGGFDFFPLPHADSRQFRDKILHQIALFTTTLPALQRHVRKYLKHKNKDKTTKKNNEVGEVKILGYNLDKFKSNQDKHTHNTTAINKLKYMPSPPSKLINRKRPKVNMSNISKYSNLAMFDVAREESRRYRLHMEKVLASLGKGARAYTIQRCWKNYKEKCRLWELEQLRLLVYQKEAAAIKLLQRRVRIYLAKKKVLELRALRLAYLLSLKKEKVVLAEVDPAWRRDMAALIIQGHVRTWLNKLRTERKRIRDWLEQKASKTIKMAFMRLIMRRRGKRILWQKRFDKAVKTLTKVQARWRGRLQRQAISDQKSAALTIERVMERRRQWNLYLKECALATRIQSIVRRRLGFNVVQKKRREKFIYDQATKCQYAWRSYKARRRISIMKIGIMLRLQRERKATKLLQRWMRGRWTRLRFLRVLKMTSLRMEGAAITIQRWHWEFVYPRIYGRLSIYANRINKMCRARLFRWRLNKLIRMTRLQKQLAYERQLEWEHLNKMAVYIQNAWRCRVARKIRRLAIQEKAHRIAQLMIIEKMQDLQNYMAHVQRRAVTNAAATQIQRIMRGYLGRKLARHKKKLKLEREKLAAMQIQSQIRSRAAARVIRQLKLAVQSIKPRTILSRKDADLENAKIEGGIGAVLAERMDVKRMTKAYLKKRHHKKNQLKVGDIVEANWAGRHRWFRGKVLRINPPSNMYEGDSYKINYVDNFIEKRVPRYWIRLLHGETELWPEEEPEVPEGADGGDEEADIEKILELKMCDKEEAIKLYNENNKDVEEAIKALEAKQKDEVKNKAVDDLNNLNKVLKAKNKLLKKKKKQDVKDKAEADLAKLQTVLGVENDAQNDQGGVITDGEGAEVETEREGPQDGEAEVDAEALEAKRIEEEAEAKRIADEEAAEEARREKDPVYIEYGMIAKKRNERSLVTKIKSKIPFTSVWWRDRKAEEHRVAINDHRAKHAIYTKSKVSSKIRTGIDDIKIVLGEKDNQIMIAQQRRNLNRRMPFYICVDVDLRANIRCNTNDDLPVYIWYKKSNKPRLVCELKIDGSFMFGGSRWADYRSQGFERVASNESRDIPNPKHWTRLPFTIWMRKSVFEIPIDDLLVSRFTRTRMEQKAMVMDGFIQFPVDLANFGMDYGLRFWYKYMQEFHDEIKEEFELVEKHKLEFRGLQGIPADIDPSYLADQAGNAEDNQVVREVVEYVGLSDHRVIQLYESFKNLCKADVNPKDQWYLTVDELFHLLGLRFGKKEYGDFVHIMWDVARIDPDEDIYFKHFVKLCGIWCIMGREQILLCVFNSQDPMKDGNVPYEQLRDLMWELHKESLQFRRRKVRGILDQMTVEDFIKDGSGKWSFRGFEKMHFKFPQLLYPLFFFQWGLCEKTLGLGFWEKQRAHLHKHRERVTQEVREHEEAIAELRIRETQAALTRATLKDSVKAILTNKPMPEGATEETLQLAQRRVRKLKKKAKRLHVDINVLVAQMK